MVSCTHSKGVMNLQRYLKSLIVLTVPFLIEFLEESIAKATVSITMQEKVVVAENGGGDVIIGDEDVIIGDEDVTERDDDGTISARVTELDTIINDVAIIGEGHIAITT